MKSFEVVRLAAESEVDPLTIRRLLKGARVHRATARVVVMAARRLGWLDRLPPEVLALERARIEGTDL